MGNENYLTTPGVTGDELYQKSSILSALQSPGGMSSGAGLMASKGKERRSSCGKSKGSHRSSPLSAKHSPLQKLLSEQVLSTSAIQLMTSQYGGYMPLPALPQQDVRLSAAPVYCDLAAPLKADTAGGQTLEMTQGSPLEAAAGGGVFYTALPYGFMNENVPNAAAWDSSLITSLLSSCGSTDERGITIGKLKIICFRLKLKILLQ